MKCLALLLFVAAMVVGCTPNVETKTSVDGSKTTVVRDGKGSVATVTEKGDSAKFSDGKGNEVSVGTDKVPDLGVEVMPGLEVEKGSVISAKTPESTSAVASFKTTKSVEEVGTFYRGKLGAGVSEGKASSGGSETISFSKEEGKKTYSVVVVKGASDEKTTVNIAFNEKLK